MRIRDMPLRVKQRIAATAILIPMAAVSMYSLSQLSSLKDDISAINTVLLRRANVIAQLNLDAASLRVNQLQHASIRSSEQKQMIADTMIAVIDRINRNLDVYDSLRTNPKAVLSNPIRERAVYASFDRNWERYLDLSFQILDLSDANRSAAAFELLNDDARTLFALFSGELQELSQINTQDAEETSLRAEQTFVSARNRILATLLITVVAALGLGIVVIRQLTGGLEKLLAAARRVADGDLSTAVEIDGRDEIGKLAQSFNWMLSSLRKSTDDTRRQAAELRDQQAVLRTKNGELESALKQVRAAQQQLILSEKMASLGHLTAGIAHEIKNPLNFVNNFAQLSADIASELREELEAARDKTVAEVIDSTDELLEDLQSNARKINEHGQRADRIVRSMLEHSRGKSGETQPVELNTFVEEYVNLAFHGMRATQQDFNVEIRRNYDNGAGPVELVPQEMGRVLINLLNNAFYAVHERGKREPDHKPFVEIATERKGDRVVIRVSDNGGGIPADLEKRVFEPFFSTKPTGKGTGLGLSLSFEIVRDGHGGLLTLDNRPGDGATFEVRIPAKSPSSSESNLSQHAASR